MNIEKAREAFTTRKGWTMRLESYRRDRLGKSDDKKHFEELSSISPENYARQAREGALQVLEFAETRLLLILKRVEDFRGNRTYFVDDYWHHQELTTNISSCIESIKKMWEEITLHPELRIVLRVHGHSNPSTPVFIYMLNEKYISRSVCFDYELWDYVVTDNIPEELWTCFAFLAGVAYTKGDIEVAREDYRRSFETLQKYGVSPQE